MGNSNKFA